MFMSFCSKFIIQETIYQILS